MFELPVFFDTRRYASVQEARLRKFARCAGRQVTTRRTWYGMKIVGCELHLLAILFDLAGEFKLGRLRQRSIA